MPYPLCEHVMSSGIRCGSPAQRGQKHCFYHGSVRTLLPKRFIGHERFRNEYDHGCRLFPMPLLEDATSIQTALMQVIHATLEGAIHFRSASIVLSALRTAQRNLALVKLEMAATTTAAMERELPSDAGQKAEVTFPNRADDQWPTSYAGEATVSPAHLNGDLGDREPKIPPNTAADGARQTAPVTVPPDDASPSDGEDAYIEARKARHGRQDYSHINGMGRLPATEEDEAASSSTSASDAGADAPPITNLDTVIPSEEIAAATDESRDLHFAGSSTAGAPPCSPAVGERVGRSPGSEASVLPFRKQPEPARDHGLREPQEPKQAGQPGERSD